MTTGPTAPVPPDANGLREAVEALADQWEKNAGTDRDSESHTLRAVVAYLRALLAASEAAPTAGEQECRWSKARNRWETVLWPGVSKEACGHVDHPATPPDDDATSVTPAQVEAARYLVRHGDQRDSVRKIAEASE